ncbi:unnamed protein product [Urochloa humidicola]
MVRHPTHRCSEDDDSKPPLPSPAAARVLTVEASGWHGPSPSQGRLRRALPPHRRHLIPGPARRLLAPFTFLATAFGRAAVEARYTSTICNSGSSDAPAGLGRPHPTPVGPSGPDPVWRPCRAPLWIHESRGVATGRSGGGRRGRMG